MVGAIDLGIPLRKRLWHQWKSLRKIPWRRKWFVGYDLEGNSYWEHIDHNNPWRLRRKVQLERPYGHFSDFKAHPMWMQWLRHVRGPPPQLDDLAADIHRQETLKVLASEADKKWKEVPIKAAIGDTDDPRVALAWTGTKSSSAPAHDQLNRINNVMAAVSSQSKKPEQVTSSDSQPQTEIRDADIPSSAFMSPKPRNG